MVADALGAAYTLSGRVADAVPLLTQAMVQATARERGNRQWRGRFLGEAQMLAGHLKEAHALAERALAHARERQERGQEAYALRLLGAIAARREPPRSSGPQPTTTRPSPWPRSWGCARLQAHCHRSLGTLYVATGQQGQATPSCPWP